MIANHRIVWLLVAVQLAVTATQPAAADDWTLVEDDRWCSGDRERLCEARETILQNRDGIAVDGNHNGGIHIEGWDGDTIRLRAFVSVSATDDERAREINDRIQIVTEGRRIYAKGPDHSRDRFWSVSFHLMVPKASDLDLETINGVSEIEGVHGDIRFEATNGGIRLTDLGGDVRGSTVNGGVVIRLAGDRWRGRSLDVDTTNGSVRLQIPEKYSADLETGTVNGSVNLDFPVMVQGKIGTTLRFTLGDGGAPVRVKTVNGGVRLERP